MTKACPRCGSGVFVGKGRFYEWHCYNCGKAFGEQVHAFVWGEGDD